MTGRMKKTMKGIAAAVDELLPPSSPTGTVPKAVNAPVTTVPNVSTSNMFQMLSDMDSAEVINSLGGPKSGDMEQKLNFVIMLLMNQQKKSEEQEESIKMLTSKAANLEKENNIIKKELRFAKESINRSELASRSLSLRILGLPVTKEELASPGEANKIATRAAYDNILKPVWVAAKNKGTLQAVPQLNTAVEFGYRVRSNAKDKRGNPLPPPLVIHLTTKQFKTELFKNKRDVMPGVIKEMFGGINIFVVEELTAPTIRRMKELREDDRVERVWSVEGSIRFCLKSDPTKPRNCFSVFGPLADIIK
jgi:hypothetical protein